MEDNIRKAAEQYIKVLDIWSENGTVGEIRGLDVYKALRASLRPSREEIADYLEEHNAWRRGDEGDMPDVKELGK